MVNDFAIAVGEFPDEVVDVISEESDSSVVLMFGKFNFTLLVSNPDECNSFLLILRALDLPMLLLL